MTATNFTSFAIDGAAMPVAATFTIGAEVSNVINVGIQLFKDAAKTKELDGAAAVLFYLANDAAGDTPTSSAPDGGIAIGANGTMIEWSANLSGLVVSEADGDIDIDVTHAAGALTVYLVLVTPTGERIISDAITFA